MKYLPTLGSTASGSLSGISAGANRGGHFLRARTFGASPATPAQRAVRQTVASVSALWSTVLSPAQRAGWNLYAQTNPVTDRLGQKIITSGFAMFTRVNISIALTTNGGSAALTAPGAVPLLLPLQVNTSATLFERAFTKLFMTFPVTIQTGDIVMAYQTKPVKIGAVANHQQERVAMAQVVASFAVGGTVWDVTNNNPWIGMVLNSPYQVRVFWIRGGNLSSETIIRGTYIT